MSNVSAKLLILTISTTTGLLLLELACRGLAPQIGWRLQRDAGLGWSSKEYQRFDPKELRAARTGRRILILGDSFLAGSGVSSLNQRFPIVVQRRLQDRVSVTILASGGWGTDQQLLAFWQKGRQWKPDIVVVAFCANNDISNILSNSHGPDMIKPYFVVDQESRLQLYTAFGEPAAFSAFQVQRPPLFQSYLLDLVRFTLRTDKGTANVGNDMGRVDERYLRFKPSREATWEVSELQPKLSWSPEQGVNHVSAYIHEDFETNSYQWQLFDALVGELQASTQAIGARLMLMLLPVAFQSQDLRFVAGSSFEFAFETPSGGFTFRAAEPRERLREIATRRGVELFDPTSEFIEILRRDGSVEEVWPNPPDRHFSALGHAILADLFGLYLQNGPTVASRV